MEIERDVPLHPFLFLGCWNNPTTRDYERVFQQIKADPIRTLILSGDNIYPFKDEDGNKRYNVAEVEKGFDIAKQGKDIVYTAVGNHNIVNPRVFEKEKELYSITNTYYCVHFADRYSLIFLNSMILINEDDEHTEELNKMFEWLYDIISNDIRYYIVMHHPIVGIRKKGSWTLPNKNRLLTVIKDNLPIGILCSHLHLFQNGLIEFQNTDGRSSPDFGPSHKRILQYIVGTGGAKLDDIPSTDFHSIIEDDGKFKYSIIKTQKTYGYTRITARGVVKFIPLIESMGGRRKRFSKTQKHSSKGRRGKAKTRGKRS